VAKIYAFNKALIPHHTVSIIRVAIIFSAASLLATGCLLQREQTDQDFTIKAPTSINPEEIESWKTYSDHKIGVSFRFPQEWPSPFIQSINTKEHAGIPAGRPLLWTINLGLKAKALCEGTDCYIWYLDGFTPELPERVITQLQASEEIEIEKDYFVHGNRIITYREPGICGDKRAFIFTSKYTMQFTGRCAEDDNRNAEIYDKILSTFAPID
jgi:hypothetical protein